MADEVQFTDEQWEAVAQAAETFAAALEVEQLKLGSVLRSNWAGLCAEGEGTMENLRALLRGKSGSFSEAVTTEAEYLRLVASQCRASKAELNSVDEAEAVQFSQ